MKDEKVIQACPSHAPQKTLTHSIRLRGSTRRSKHLDATGGCHSCKIRPEFPVIIPDEVLWSLPILRSSPRMRSAPQSRLFAAISLIKLIFSGESLDFLACACDLRFQNTQKRS